MLPARPKIFHGRNSELESIVAILVQDTARIAILGAGGMGKTSLATAALYDPRVEAKYSHQYFVPCDSTPTCVELVSAVADHIRVEKGPNLAKKVAQHFMQAPPCLIVLDNLETPWEISTMRPEVEEFLSLLTDIPHLGLMVSGIFFVSWSCC
jgi:ABC-type iron transport system FetAB ATPase subunit